MVYFIAGCIFILLLQNYWRNRSRNIEVNYHRQNLEKLREDDRWGECEHEYLNVFEHKATKMLLYDSESAKGFEMKLKVGPLLFKESLGCGPLDLKALDSRCSLVSAVMHSAVYSL